MNPCVYSKENLDISINLQMADLVISDGYHDVGYTYVNVDDCWLSHERDRRGRLQADPLRFPSGMGALADYVSPDYMLAQSIRIFRNVN